MPDEIITELWQIKDDIALEHQYDIDTLVLHLQARKRRVGQQAVDLRILKGTAETQNQFA